MRIESVQNANDQAQVVAKTICGDTDVTYEAMPWFWSDQYDTKLQTAGILSGYDELLVRGDPTQNKFSVIYLKQGKFQAIDCVNVPSDFAQSRKCILRTVTNEIRLDMGDAGNSIKSIFSD